MDPYVFVSYARKQFYVAEQLAATLRSLGLPAWLDVQEIDPGADWQAAIMRGIEGCRAIVVVASRASYHSHAVRAEIAAAHVAGKPIYLAVVDDTPFLKVLKGRATAIDCRGGFYERMKVLAKAIRTGDRRDNLLKKRRFFFIPRLPFGFAKYLQLLAVNLFFALGTVFIIWQKQVTVTKTVPQALPLVILIGTPVALWFLSFAYSLYLVLAFRFQRPVSYTVLDVWPVFCLFIPVALLFFLLSFNTTILGLFINLGFTVSSRSTQNPLLLALVVTGMIALLIAYGMIVFSSLRNLVLVFGAGLFLGTLVGVVAQTGLPPIFWYPPLLLVVGAITYASLRGSITGQGAPDGMGATGWTATYGTAGSQESREWGRWLTPGAFVNEAFLPQRQSLRERPAPAMPTNVKTWHLHYVPADVKIAEDIRRVFASYPSLQEVPLAQARYHLVVVSNRTPRGWLEALDETLEQIICVVVSAIDIAALAEPLQQNQLVDYRQQRPDQLASLARALAGDGRYVNLTTPEDLARPRGPYPVALVSHALRIGGLVAIILGAAALLIVHASGLALFSIPQAALSVLIGAGAYWEAQRLRVRATSVAALIATSVLLWLDLVSWLIGAAVVRLAPRAMLIHNGDYNQYLTVGFQMVAFFIGAPLVLLFLAGWVECFRRFSALARWLPRPALPLWRGRLTPPPWKRLDATHVVYALVVLLITALLVVDSPYQFPKVHEFDVPLAHMTPAEVVYSSGGKLWFSVSGNNAGYGLGYILPDGTMKAVQFLTPQPADCPFSPNSASVLFPDCYEGGNLRLGPDHNFWYVTHMLFDPAKVQIVRVTPAGVATVFPLPTHSKLGTSVDFTFDTAGNLWFTQVISTSLSDSMGVVGRIDISGHLSEFPAMAHSQPSGIVAGPDGTMWFTDAERGEIVKITPAGRMSFYYAPVLHDAGDIIAGDDQHIWFSAPGADGIGRIAVDGALQMFYLPPGSTPGSLVWGPDNAVWFLDPGHDAIGRVSPDGMTIAYPLPAPVGARAPFIVGRDGNLWCALDHAVARVSPSGAITQYALPTLDAAITSMVSAPNHHIWFVEDTGTAGLIGEITP